MAGPGRRVGQGHLRVDTARAVQKLRAYQLADPTAWILEVVRSAVMLGATELEADGDANDVSLRWQDGTLDDDEMRAVLDALVNPGDSERGIALRRLAIGVNTALGFGPRSLDIIRSNGDGTGARVRYTPAILDAEVREAGGVVDSSALRALAPMSVSYPGPKGMHVVLRRRIGFDMLKRFFSGAEPPELVALREFADDVRVPLHVGDVTLHEETAHYDIVRLPLGQGMRGFVAIVDPHAAPADEATPWIDYAEQGVILSRAALPRAQFKGARGNLPIRAMLDWDTLPTNASRSGVRVDDGLRAGRARAEALLPKLITGAAKRYRALGDTPAEQRERDRLRLAFLQMLRCYSGHLNWRIWIKQLPGPLVQVAKLPLIRDAAGNPAPIAGDWRAQLLHLGPEPLDAPDELREAVPWIPPDDPARVLLGDALPNPKLLADAVEESRRTHAARERFYASPVRPVSVGAPAGGALLTAAIVAPDKGGFAALAEKFDGDIHGEVCLFEPTTASGGRITLMYEGRALEVCSVDSAVPFVAAVSSPRITPTEDFSRANVNRHRRDAMLAAEVAALRAIEFYAARSLDTRAPLPPDVIVHRPPASLREDRRIDMFRRGLRLAARKTELRGRLKRKLKTKDKRARARHEEAIQQAAISSPLASVDALRVSGLDKPGEETMPRSLRQVGAAARERDVLPYAPFGAHAAHLLLHDDRISALAIADLVGTLAVESGRRDPKDVAFGGPPSAIATMRVDGAFGSRVIALMPGDPELKGALVLHGAEDARRKFPTLFLPVEVRAHDLRALVDTKRRVHGRFGDDEELRQLECAFFQALARVFAGEREFGVYVTSDDAVAAALVRAMARPGARQALGDELYEKVWNTHRWPTLLQSVSLGELDRALAPGAPTTVGSGAVQRSQKGRGRLRYLTPEDASGARGLAEENFYPLILPATVARDVARLLGTKHHNCRAELRARLDDRARTRRRDVHFAQPPALAPLNIVSDGAEGEWGDARGTLGLGAAGLDLQILVGGRLFAAILQPDSPPVAGQLDVPEEWVDEQFEKLKPSAHERLMRVVRDVFRERLRGVVAERPAEIFEPHYTRAFTRLLGRKRLSKGDQALAAELREAAIWPTVQGGVCSIEQAKQRGRVRVTSFEGQWLAAQDGKRRSPLDKPIIRLAKSAPGRALFDLLKDVPESDATEAIRALQGRRRVARGLVPTPKLGLPGTELAGVRSIEKACKGHRKTFRALGPGEVRLSLHAERTTAKLFLMGEPALSVNVDVFPPIDVAFEAPTYLEAKGKLKKGAKKRLEAHLRKLAERLVIDALDKAPAGREGDLLRRRASEAWLNHGHIRDDQMDPFALLPTTGGEWHSLHEARHQANVFGEVWATRETDLALEPVDADRVAYRLTDKAQKRLAKILGQPVTDATGELRDDEKLRRNLRKPLVESLDTRPVVRDQQVIARVPVDRDGARAEIALLHPTAGSLAKVLVHRDQRPLGVLDSPSGWPALIMLDDPDLTPDRTYSAAVDDARRERTLKWLTREVDKALRGLLPDPVSVQGVRASFKTNAGFAVRGVLRLVDDPTASGVIRTPYGRDREHVVGPPIEGTLLVGQTRKHRDIATSAARRVYGRLLRKLRLSWAEGRGDADTVKAHLIRGLLAGAINADDEKLAAHLRDTTLDCFHPQPRTLADAGEWLSAGPIRVVTEPDGPPSLVDDGGVISRAILVAIGARARRVAKREPEPPKKKKEKRAPKAKRAHALDPLARSLEQRLRQLLTGEPVRVFVSHPRERPLIDLTPDGDLVLAGRSGMLRAIQDARAAGVTPARVEAAFVHLSAHAVRLLNGDRSGITDAVEAGALRELADTVHY